MVTALTGRKSHPLPAIPQWNGQEEEEEEQWHTPVQPRQASQDSKERQASPRSSTSSVTRQTVPSLQHPELRLQEAPSSPVNISPPRGGLHEADSASIRNTSAHSFHHDDARRPSPDNSSNDAAHSRGSSHSLPLRGNRVASAGQRLVDEARSHSRASSGGSQPTIAEEGSEHDRGRENREPPLVEGLQYNAFDGAPKKRSQNRVSQMTANSAGSGSGSSSSDSPGFRASQSLGVPRALPRPNSTLALGSELRGRNLSPHSANGSDPSSPRPRDVSNRRISQFNRPTSYIDLLNNVPYSQQVAPSGAMNNAGLQSAVGNAASLLDTKKTLDMYRANVKKTNDASVQYEFALFMVNAAQDAQPEDGLNSAELTNEAKQILTRLADRAYPFAQYYLGDGYFSGLFNKDKPDRDKAFTLFVAASKHGHAEASYRAALCYEFGWGTAKSYPKAVNFYRASASKNHPGAAARLGMACIRGDMGMSAKEKYREGLKWLKRAQESADAQYNSAPYELGMMHLQGFGDDVFKDEAYAAQLLTQSAELGHAEANFVLGQAYENGRYGCPRDAALSVHFYNGAAMRGHAEAMLALCAWYMVGAEPVLEKDEAEAFAWARQAAETGFPKAQYAVAYFTEMGIGTSRDPLEANVWYVRAADQGNATARQRLDIIRQASAGDPGIPMSKAEARSQELGGGRKKFMGIF